MAQISRKKSIIKKRVSKFHASPKKQTKKEKIITTIARPAAYIQKQAKSKEGQKIIKGIGSFLKGWAEASREMQKQQSKRR